jgi:hypothetical protein
MKAAPKSELVKQAEKLFPAQTEPSPSVLAYEQHFAYPSEQVLVQTFTTYSVCEDPIPNPYKRQ